MFTFIEICEDIHAILSCTNCLCIMLRPSKINIKIPGTRPTLSITAELENFITSSMADTISLAGTSQGVDNKRR